MIALNLKSTHLLTQFVNWSSTLPRLGVVECVYRVDRDVEVPNCFRRCVPTFEVKTSRSTFREEEGSRISINIRDQRAGASSVVSRLSRSKIQSQESWVVAALQTRYIALSPVYAFQKGGKTGGCFGRTWSGTWHFVFLLIRMMGVENVETNKEQKCKEFFVGAGVGSWEEEVDWVRLVVLAAGCWLAMTISPYERGGK